MGTSQTQDVRVIEKQGQRVRGFDLPVFAIFTVLILTLLHALQISWALVLSGPVPVICFLAILATISAYRNLASEPYTEFEKYFTGASGGYIAAAAFFSLRNWPVVEQAVCGLIGVVLFVSVRRQIDRGIRLSPQRFQGKSAGYERDWTDALSQFCGATHVVLPVAGSSKFGHVLVFPDSSQAGSFLDGRALGRTLSLVAKRLIDVCGTVVAGMILLPLLAIVATLVAITSRGSILFSHPRIGQGNRTFRVWKFRTMHQDAKERLAQFLAANPVAASEWAKDQKLKDDPRVTGLGRVLRRFSLDELPQLWNVLRGEMSLVGPRPIVTAEIAKYGNRYGSYESVRPGLTGLWQISGRNDTTYEERVALDHHYVQTWSLWQDARIIAKTFRAVLSGVGAY